LKSQEAEEAHCLRKARPLWMIAAAAFLLWFVLSLCLPSATIRPARLWFGGVLAAVYLVNAILIGRKLWQLTRIDYTESLRSFLDKAELRHRFMGPQAGWLAGLGLMVLGGVSGVYFHDAFLRRYVDPEHQALGIALYCLGYLLVCAAGFTFTYRNWKRDKAPLLAEIRKMKLELMTNDADASSEADT
ncbi:MAG TPA: hypothetical protein P5055_22960, partial [Candidatus Paceibacterota bacterium]|nr:hypothetical protein [Candidatus Paceibacterota bacterium]